MLRGQPQSADGAVAGVDLIDLLLRVVDDQKVVVDELCVTKQLS